MDETQRLSIIYQDIRMATQQEVDQAARGTVFEGSYPAESEKQCAIVEHLRWMLNGSSEAEAQASCSRVLDQALGINQQLSW